MPIKKGIVELPLHHGSCPRWLFPKMVKLAGSIIEIISYEYGTKEFLIRVSEPYWFQALGCILGFDWHSSGLTTTVCASIKEALNNVDIGMYVAGGKGKMSKKTPQEIENKALQVSLNENKTLELIKASKLVAKVDNNALQDGFQLYHHSFFFDNRGNWTVVQQGMNNENRYARRYHWLSDKVKEKSFVNEPHSGICCDTRTRTLNLVAKENSEIRKCSVDLVKDNPSHLKKYINKIFKIDKNQTTLSKFFHHKIDVFSLSPTHFPKITIDMKTLMKAYELQPRDYEELLLIKGMGPKNLRALALISEVIYGCKASWRDPVKFSFAHGGKDGWPEPINKRRYENSIKVLQDAVKQAKLGKLEKIKAIKRLNLFISYF